MKNPVQLWKALAVLVAATAHLQVFAQNAALSAAASPANAPQAALEGASRSSGMAASPASPTPGRLFYSAERRQVLDQQRKTLQFQETIVEGDTFKLNGIVTRSSGKWTLWINDSAVTERDGKVIGAEPIAGQTGRGRLSAGEPGTGSRVIAVGDGLDRSTGSVNNALGNGAVRVHSRPTGR